MRRPYLVLVGVMFCTALGFGLYFLSTGRGGSDEDDAGVAKAPAFSLPDATGAVVDLEDVAGDVVVIHFWASWSPYAKDDLTSLASLKKMYAGDVGVVALNRDHSPKEGQDFLASLELGDELTFVYDKDDVYYKEVGGYAMPETIFLNEEGDIIAHVHTPVSYEEIKQQIDSMLE